MRSRFPSSADRRAALSLVDVLAVIAAVVLLVFVWQAYFVRMPPRHRSRIGDCMQNLSTIGKAIYVYAENNGEFYPCLPGRSASDSLALLYPDYLPLTVFFKCPSTQDAPKLSRIEDRDRKVIDRWFGAKPEWPSYGYDPEVSFRTATALQPILADMDGSYVANPGASTANHTGGQNVLFYDTHVDWNSTNTWNNHDIPDNIFTRDHDATDADVATRKDARAAADTDTYIRR